MRIGFVGLGRMGGAIARNLRKAGTVVALDSRPETQADLAADGIERADGPEGIAACEMVFLCLPDGDVVEAVLFGEGGLAPHLRADQIVVDLSTIAYAQALAIGQRLADRRVRLLDAPISGQPARAADGTLTVMCGGQASTFAEAKPLLDCIGTIILHMGPTGSGQLTKTINNCLYDINIAALAEMLPVAARLGLDPERIAQVVTTGTARSFAAEYFVPRMLAGRFDEGYRLGAAYKDLVSGLGAATAHGLPTPVLSAAAATYQTAMLDGHGDKDKGAMILPVEARLGVAFRTGGGR